MSWRRKLHGLCEAKDGTQVDELLQAGESGHKRIRQEAKNESRFLKMAGSLPRRQETGRLKVQKKETYQEGIQKTVKMSLRWEDSWHRKGLSNLAREEKCCRTEVHSRRKKETLSERRPCTRRPEKR